jgi:streptomycin 6-kinase
VWRLTSLDEDLHTSAKAEDEMQGRFLLDVVVGQGATILKLLAGEDQALLVWGNALLVLDLALDIVDSVGGLNLEGDGLSGDCEGVSS